MQLKLYVLATNSPFFTSRFKLKILFYINKIILKLILKNHLTYLRIFYRFYPNQNCNHSF